MEKQMPRAKWSIKPLDTQEKLALQKYIEEEIANPSYRRDLGQFDFFVEEKSESQIEMCEKESR
jgi:hypothetical protein